jgi:hypothetical protein
MKLTAYTRRLEECRKRWNHRTVQYVLQAALILRAARKAAKDERRWGQWIRDEIHMNRSTVYRYLRVAKFLRENDDLGQHLAPLSIVKIYALARLKRSDVVALVKNGKAESLSDVSFLKLARRLQPQPKIRLTRPNILKSIEASLARLDRSVKQWQQSRVVLPAALQLRVRARIRAVESAMERIGRTTAAAM